MLGPRMKYSSCLYPKGSETLAQAEVEMLRTYSKFATKLGVMSRKIMWLTIHSAVEKAGLEDGMSILDLGCGWGSGALFFAEMLPNSKVTAFSNSRTQKEYIDAKAKEKGLANLNVITGDVAVYEFEKEKETFDRVVSIEVCSFPTLLVDHEYDLIVSN